MILETERLTLDELTLADAPFILDLLMSRGFRENIGDRGVRDLESAGGYIERAQAGYAANGFGLWRCDVKATGEPAGLCGLVKREGLEHPDVGYAFLERFWGCGYASESAAASLAYGRDVLGLGTIVAITTPANLGSIAVLRKIGLRDAGMIRLPGHDHDSAYFTSAPA
ncbi:MAG TPA: GNAT family N-acetyltransferase [Phenylobacterium sp.]|uniref:GNAT family N-acetyltransferase n=1 Tax=Phenylobacterium sp. TaxID=1871053 RepID=UPI002CC26C2F|nr:GNAT family N-acetyltransferase [Phenylobacterium sp.]HXA39552.1 GNAT family N-acetyltransferase [Phenylobacterium sp.]